jgi:hypothetical protein
MGPAEADRARLERPVRRVIISDKIEIAVSSGVRAPMSRPIGDLSLARPASSTPASRSLTRRLSWVRRDPITPM